jgi:type I site-specific restriction-modification system R (restriction) subunit
VVLVGRLREAIRRLNPVIPEEAREEALRKVLRVGTPALVQTNRAFHRMLRDGVPVEYPRPDGSIAGDHVRLVDFDDMRANDWLAVNQFTVIEGQHNRRPDIVVIAAELISQVKKSVTIDWTLRESARAKIKMMVKRILNKHGYPPDLQEEAVKTVLAQAELLCAEWV